MTRAALTCYGLLLAALLTRSAAALDAPRKVADYDIAVSLDPKTHLFEGTETLRWTNPAGVAVSDLKFHLYWNAFRNNRSTFVKESGGQLRGDRMEKENGWGFIDVTSMTWDGQDLTKGFRFESPDDGNPDDRTVLSVALPRPVAPGETVALKISWKAKAPRVFARAGYVRDFYFVGQWFPKIGVLEPAGSRRRAAPAWNGHQYHANSEFFADWGDYRVAMTVPENFVVGSAGTKVGETRAGGRKTLVYELKDAHDFAWSADPRFVLKESLFDPAKDIPKAELERASKTLGRTPEELLRDFRPVKLFFYMQPEHAAAWRKHEDAQKWALAWFGLWAFPYPYPQVSMVDPPEDGWGAGGMEYQTLYTTIDSKWFGFWPGSGLHVPEMVTIHEFGHGYWYGMLASNEFEESWMDEGIASFTEAVIVDRHYPWYYGFPWGVGVHDEELQRADRGVARFRPDPPELLELSRRALLRPELVRTSGDRHPADPPPRRRGEVLASVPGVRRTVALGPADDRGLPGCHAVDRDPRLRGLRQEDDLWHRLRRFPGSPRDEREVGSVCRVRRRREGDQPSEEKL